MTRNPDLEETPNAAGPAVRSGLQTGEMRAILREELADLTRQLGRLEAALDDTRTESPADRRARARASLLSILDRLA